MTHRITPTQTQFDLLRQQMNAPEMQAQFDLLRQQMNAPEMQAQFDLLRQKINLPETEAQFEPMFQSILRQNKEDTLFRSEMSPPPSFSFPEIKIDPQTLANLTVQDETNAEKSDGCCCGFFDKIWSVICKCFSALGSAFKWVFCCGKKSKETDFTSINMHNQAHQTAMDMHNEATRIGMDMHTQAHQTAMDMHNQAFQTAMQF